MVCMIGKNELNLKSVNVKRFAVTTSNGDPYMGYDNEDGKNSISLKDKVFSYRGWGGKTIPIEINIGDIDTHKPIEKIDADYFEVSGTKVRIHGGKKRQTYDLKRYSFIYYGLGES